MKVGILGTGKFGLSLGKNINSKDLYYSSPTGKILENINMLSLKDICNVDILIISISAQYIIDYFENSFKNTGQLIMIASKGIDIKKGFISKYLLENNILKKKQLSIISGPSFASELMEHKNTVFTIATKSKKNYKILNQIFSNNIKTYYTKDIIGVEISGSYKNIIAIASGIVKGLNLGINTQTALISRGLIEMYRFSANFGSKKGTFMNVSGAGDLFMTSLSENSRNYRFGMYIAEGKTLEEIKILLNGEIAEGYFTLQAIIKIANELKVYVPIANELHLIINKSGKIEDSLKRLMT
jgi:glycerol-3-phosphate dehydrogenase (NAD(P)+)